MKILHVIDQISQKTGGGASKVAFELARAQAQLGHDVTIYTTDYNAKEQAAPPSFKLVKFRNWFDLFGVLSVAPGLLFAKYDYDVMHLHNWRTIVNVLACLRKRPTIVQAHGSSRPIKGLTKPLHDLVWGGLILKRAGRCIADADVEVQHYVTEGVNRDKVVVIPVGINLDEFRIMPRYNSQYKTVLFLGRLDEIKGVDLLVKAFSLVKDDNIRLKISGIDYGVEKELKALIRELGLGSRVDWIGPVYGAEKTKVYTNADVFVMPSRYEMWGITFMEALACSTPVIMTDTCEASSLLPLECGIVVPLNEVALAEGIKTALDTNLVSRYRKYRWQWVAQYSWTNIAALTIKLYKEVLDEQ